MDSSSCILEMKDGEHKETAKDGAVRNNLLTTANVPNSTENKLEHESLGVIVQQQHWQHPERPIGITRTTPKSGLHVASSLPDPFLRASPTNTSSLVANHETEEKIATTGREVTTPNKRQAQSKPRPNKKQPENANQKEIRLQRNRSTSKARRDKQRAEVDAKQQKITEVAIKNNVLRQNIQIKFQELVGGPPGVDDTSTIREKMNVLVSSFTRGTFSAKRENGESLDTIPPSSDSLLPVTSLPAIEEFNKALQLLLLQQERSKQTPQLPPGAHLHGLQQRSQRPHLDNDAPRQQQQQQQQIHEQHRTLVELYSIRVRQLQQQVVHSNDREQGQQSQCDAQQEQLRKEVQGTFHDEIALDQRQKSTDHQGHLNRIICEEDLQLTDHPRQELGKKRQKKRQDDISLHMRHKQEQHMIDYRRQQLKEKE